MKTFPVPGFSNYSPVLVEPNQKGRLDSSRAGLVSDAVCGLHGQEFKARSWTVWGLVWEPRVLFMFYADYVVLLMSLGHDLHSGLSVKQLGCESTPPNQGSFLESSTVMRLLLRSALVHSHSNHHFWSGGEMSSHCRTGSEVG